MADERFHERLEEFLSDAMSDADREAFVRELESNPDRSRAFDEALRMDALLHVSHRDGTPTETRTRNDGALRPVRRRPVGGASEWRGWAISLAAMVLCAIGLSLILGSGGDPRGKTPRNAGEGPLPPDPSLVPEIVRGALLVDGGPIAEVPLDKVVQVARGDKTQEAVLAVGRDLNMRLRPSSSFTIRSSGADTYDMELHKGSGVFRVDAALARKFTVHTKVGWVSARGQAELEIRMALNLKKKERQKDDGGNDRRHEMRLSVTGGAVEVAASSQREILRAGERRVFSLEFEATPRESVHGVLRRIEPGRLILVRRGKESEERDQEEEVPVDLVRFVEVYARDPPAAGAKSGDGWAWRKASMADLEVGRRVRVWMRDQRGIRIDILPAPRP